MRPIFGIDFGTTNSALSINLDDHVEVVNIDQFNIEGKTLRSVLYFNNEREIFTGQNAIIQYINDGASGRFMQSVKKFLPDKSFTSTDIFGKNYKIEDLVAIILKDIKKAGEEFIGKKVDSVVMGRPVVFSEDKEKDNLAQQRLEKAGLLAGFKNVYFQLEPIAAALSFESSLKTTDEKNVLIGDFGGGTSDFVIIRLRGITTYNVNRKSDILSTGGLTIGGDTFDSNIMWEKIAKYFGRYAKYKLDQRDFWMTFPLTITRTLCQWHLIPRLRERKTKEAILKFQRTIDDPVAIKNLIDIIENNFGFSLFRSIEKAKCSLLSLENSVVFFKEWELEIREKISRIEFEDMSKEDIDKISECISITVKKSGLSDDQIDEVFITGGTSHIPCIRELFISRFGKNKMKQMDAFTSVAYGLGKSASYIF